MKNIAKAIGAALLGAAILLSLAPTVWTPVTVHVVSGNSATYSVQPSDAVILCTGTGQDIITLNLTTVGKMITVIEKNVGGTVVITNTLGAVFTVPGIGTNQTPSGVQLGGWNTATNEWTGVYDGANW